MFDIEYKGGNAIIITTKKSKLVIDPMLSHIGLKDVVVANAVELATDERFVIRSSGARLVIDSPGEYEIGEFSIRGIAAQACTDTDSDAKKSTIYRLEIGDVRIAVFGNISHDINDDQFEELGSVDMAIIPVGGGGYTLDATNAANILRAIDCKVVIPVHYADSSIKYEVQQEELGVFLKEFGGDHEITNKYKIKAVSSVPLASTVVEITRS
mgnify:CR=1 FL=1